MARLDNLEVKRKRTKKKVIIIMIAGSMVATAYSVGSAIAYKIELNSLQKRIIDSNSIPRYLKKDLVPGYTEEMGE